MRINYRMKIGNFTLFFMISKSQKLNGLTSKLDNGKHIVMLDCENVILTELIKTLQEIQKKYNLGEMFIMSDIEKSYRVWCFTQIDFKTLLKIILDCPYIDYNFFYWTVFRGKATLRLSKKLNREPQKIVFTLEGKKEFIPNKMEFVEYDTGNDKKGRNILLGDN